MVVLPLLTTVDGVDFGSAATDKAVDTGPGGVVDDVVGWRINWIGRPAISAILIRHDGRPRPADFWAPTRSPPPDFFPAILDTESNSMKGSFFSFEFVGFSIQFVFT